MIEFACLSLSKVRDQRDLRPHVEGRCDPQDRESVVEAADFGGQSAGMAWTYMLECRDGSFYVGSTTNLEVRVRQHQDGTGAVFTRRRRPVRLVWAAEFSRVSEAFEMEKRIQNWSRAKRLALIEGRFGDLPALSRSRRPPRQDDGHS